MAKQKEDLSMADVCKGCVKWDAFGKKCWVYWESKKACSHYEDEFGNFGKGLGSFEVL